MQSSIHSADKKAPAYDENRTARTEAAVLEPALQQPRDSISEHGEQDHDADIIRQEEHNRKRFS